MANYPANYFKGFPKTRYSRTLVKYLKKGREILPARIYLEFDIL